MNLENVDFAKRLLFFQRRKSPGRGRLFCMLFLPLTRLTQEQVSL